MDRDEEEIIAEGETRHLCLGSNGTPKSLPQEFFDLLAK
jgi:acyl-CoA thioesterase FadM